VLGGQAVLGVGVATGGFWVSAQVVAEGQAAVEVRGRQVADVQVVGALAVADFAEEQVTVRKWGRGAVLVAEVARLFAAAVCGRSRNSALDQSLGSGRVP
jgi:hypothetical protein